MVWCQCSEGCQVRVLSAVMFLRSWCIQLRKKELRIESAHNPQLRARRAGDRIPSGARDIFFSRTVQTVSGAHPLPSSVAAEAFSREQRWGGVKLTTQRHLVSRLRISGSTPPLPYSLHGVDRNNFAFSQSRTNKIHCYREKSIILCNQSPAYFGPSGPLSRRLVINNWWFPRKDSVFCW
jgi:hypothetical protein